jgi:molybdopterin converting factor small subunit
VVVPGQLQGYTRGQAEVTAQGATVDQVLQDLDRQFPGMRFRVIDEQDRVRQHIMIFVGDERRDAVGSIVPDGATIHILGALSGG